MSVAMLVFLGKPRFLQFLLHRIDAAVQVGDSSQTLIMLPLGDPKLDHLLERGLYFASGAGNLLVYEVPLIDRLGGGDPSDLFGRFAAIRYKRGKLLLVKGSRTKSLLGGGYRKLLGSPIRERNRDRLALRAFSGPCLLHAIPLKRHDNFAVTQRIRDELLLSTPCIVAIGFHVSGTASKAEAKIFQKR
jgi:hypothetical protein